MSKSRTTQKMIAKELGITTTTVSKALKDYPDISLKTKEAVKALAREWNYFPDYQALAFKSKHTRTIGLVIPEIVHFFFSNVIKGILQSSEERGYQLLITLSRNSRELEETQLNLLYGQRVEGILISLANETADHAHFMFLQEQEVPIVMFDKVAEGFNCQKVIIDDEKGGFIATEHLISRGCKRIAHIRGPLKPLNSIGRFEGYRKALAAHGIPFEPQLVKTCTEVNFQEGYDFALELLQQYPDIDGIFTVTDQVGVGALKAARSLGLRVPEDLKIIGFSDSQIAQVSEPPLSTIHQPGFEIGQTAARILIDEIEGTASPSPTELAQEYILNTSIIVRGSTDSSSAY